MIQIQPVMSKTQFKIIGAILWTLLTGLVTIGYIITDQYIYYEIATGLFVMGVAYQVLTRLYADELQQSTQEKKEKV